MTIPAFDLNQIEAGEVVNITRIAQDIGIHFGIMQVREQARMLYSTRTPREVVDIWQKAVAEGRKVTWGPLEEGWPHFLREKPLSFIVRGWRSARSRGLTKAVSVASSMIEARVRSGQFLLTREDITEAVEAMGGVHCAKGTMTIGKIAEKLRAFRRMGEEGSRQAEAAVKALPKALAEAISSHKIQPLGQERPGWMTR